LDRPYDVLFVTDHGHVDSLPFEKRDGKRIKDYLLDGPVPPMSSELERALLDGRPAPVRALAAEREMPEIIEAGNFAHIYLTKQRQPLEAIDLLARCPEALSRAASHKDIGIVALRRRDHAVALIRGKPYTAEEIEASPLPGAFSKRAVADLLRELPHMPTAGDIVLYGEAVNGSGTVGFAWEFGSHGGLTKTETDSVICWPSEVPLDLGGLSHCSQLYERLSAYYRN
jgi:hypothetical protein